MSVDTPWPQIDVGALQKESTAYQNTSTELDATWSNIRNNVSQPLFEGSDPWTGDAATACSTLTTNMSVDNIFLTVAMNDASTAIDTYVKAVATHQATYDHAAGMVTSIESDGLGPHMNRQQQSAQLKHWNAIATQAVSDVKKAAHTYAGSLRDAISTAKIVPDRSLGGSDPNGLATEKNPADLIDGKYFTMLFGSVIGTNRINGIKFEGDVLKELGFDKNTKLYEINVPGKGTIRVIPDGDDDTTVLEIKNVNSLSASRQLLGEIRVAQESGRTPVIVTDDRTKLSGPLRRLAENGQVKIYQRTGPGEYTNAVTGDEMQADPDNRGIVPKDPDGATDKGTVGEAGDSGGEDGPVEMPDDPGGGPPEVPEEPEVPEIPEDPLPELPEFPELLP